MNASKKPDGIQSEVVQAAMSRRSVFNTDLTVTSSGDVTPKAPTVKKPVPAPTPKKTAPKKAPTVKPDTRKVVRNAGTGEFTTKAAAKVSPATTVTQTVPAGQAAKVQKAVKAATKKAVKIIDKAAPKNVDKAIAKGAGLVAKAVISATAPGKSVNLKSLEKAAGDVKAAVKKKSAPSKKPVAKKAAPAKKAPAKKAAKKTSR